MKKSVKGVNPVEGALIKDKIPRNALIFIAWTMSKLLKFLNAVQITMVQKQTVKGLNLTEIYQW